MCTLAIYFKVFPGYPVVVAANRDEYLAREALPPTTLSDEPHIVGGKDLRASGTWLGINEHGLAAGLLNRRRADNGNDPNLRSRGLLCLDVLRYATAAEAVRFVERQRGTDYNPFNLLIASREQTFVAHNRGDKIELHNSPNARISLVTRSRRARNSQSCSPIIRRNSIRARGAPTRCACIWENTGRAHRA